MAKRTNKTISGDALEREIRSCMKEVSRLTETALKNTIDQTSKEIITMAKGRAPHRSGEYRKGFTSKVTSRFRGCYNRVVYNKNKPGLTHLLQHGHGGPILARAYPHIPSDDETEKIIEKNMDKEMAKL